MTASAPVLSRPARLDFLTKISYGLGSLAVGVKDGGFKSLLLIYYNQVVGLPASKVAIGIMIALVIDALSDPIVGQVSDNWRSRWGRRHPFMYFSALPTSLAFLCLWFPPIGWSQEALLAYMIVTAVAVRLFITFYEVPASALVPELTADYDERTSLMSYRYYFFFTGGLVLSILTFRVFLQPDAEFPVGQLNPNGYHRYALVAAGVMFVSILLAALGTHRHIPRMRKRHELGKIGLLGTLRNMAQTLANKSFLMLSVAALCKSMVLGISHALGLYLYTYYWEFTSSEIAILMLDSIFSAMIAASLSRPLSRKFGKRNVCMAFYIGAFLVGVTPLILRHFGLFWENHSPYLVPTLFAHGVIFSALGMSSTILAFSMLADVVEDSERRTGRRSDGLFFAAGSFITKSVSGVGIFGAGLILAFVEFPRGARPGELPFEMLDKLAMSYIPVAATLYAIGLFCMSRYDITRESHERTVSELAKNRQT